VPCGPHGLRPASRELHVLWASLSSPNRQVSLSSCCLQLLPDRRSRRPSGIHLLVYIQFFSLSKEGLKNSVLVRLLPGGNRTAGVPPPCFVWSKRLLKQYASVIVGFCDLVGCNHTVSLRSVSLDTSTPCGSGAKAPLQILRYRYRFICINASRSACILLKHGLRPLPIN